MSKDKIKTILKDVFKHDRFKNDVQENATREIYKREKDVIVSMPTGSGKSLCYQLPSAVYDDKVALVFSPLLALIKDQIDHLSALKIKACSLNSKMSKKDREAVINDLKNDVNIRLLYITPEQAVTKTFRELYINLLKNKKVSYIIVDEAHCISQWGHDFRPDYLRLSELRMDDSVPCIAVTATAGPEVVKDIVTNLKLKKDYGMFKVSCFRKNLFYDVIYRNLLDNPYQHLWKFIKDCLKDGSDTDIPKNDRSCGIIYCRTREQTEVVAEKLTQLGIKTYCYHSGLGNKDRLERQEKWQNGDYPVICATISFGMGVDKASVRFVIHWGVAKDPASYYQESGRAGRDGKRSHCRLYYDRSDQKAIEFHLKSDLVKAQQDGNRSRQAKAERSMEAFSKIVEYCESARLCRHRLFSDHFGDAPPRCKKTCDICTDQKGCEERVNNFLLTSIQYNSRPSDGYVDCSELYEGGRIGAVRDYNEAVEDDDGSGSEREKRAKKETEDLIRKQFALRRGMPTITKDCEDEDITNSKVKAASSTLTKVIGLTVPVRERNVEMIRETLQTNYDTCKPENFEPDFSTKDLEDIAINMEYEIFTSKTNITMYRSSIVKLISHIKKSTQILEFRKEFSGHIPMKEESRKIKDLFYGAVQIGDKVSKRSREERGFQSAKEMLDRRALKKLKLSDKSQSSISDFFNKSITNGKKPEEKPKSPMVTDCTEDDPKPVPPPDLLPTEIPTVNDYIKTHDAVIKKGNKRQYVSSADIIQNIKKDQHHLHNEENKEVIELNEPKSDESEEEKINKHSNKSSTNKNKQQIGQFIVQLLMPAYSLNRFQSKESFKSVARKITHDVIGKDIGGEDNIKEYVSEFVKKYKVLKE